MCSKNLSKKKKDSGKRAEILPWWQWRQSGCGAACVVCSPCRWSRKLPADAEPPGSQWRSFQSNRSPLLSYSASSCPQILLRPLLLNINKYEKRETVLFHEDCYLKNDFRPLHKICTRRVERETNKWFKYSWTSEYLICMWTFSFGIRIFTLHTKLMPLFVLM